MRRPPAVPLVAALVLAVALAGCVGPAASPATEAPAQRTFPWGLSGCAYVIVVVPADEEALRGVLPPGFEPAPSRLAPLPAGPRAEFHADAYVCNAGVALDGATVRDVVYGSYYVPVEPPATLREEGYDDYFVKLDFLAPDAARIATLVDAGLPARAGDAEVLLGAGRVEARLAFDDGTGFAYEGAAGPEQTFDGALPFVEHTPLEGGGLARWHARLHHASASLGPGVATFAAGSLPARLAGGERVAATAFSGAWNVDEADVTFPLAWP